MTEREVENAFPTAGNCVNHGQLPHAATLPPSRKTAHAATVAQLKSPHAAKRPPSNAPHPATVVQRRAPHPALGQRRELAISAPLEITPSALQLMKRAREKPTWLSQNGLNTKDDVLRFISDNPTKEVIAQGEWNRDYPGDPIGESPKRLKLEPFEAVPKELVPAAPEPEEMAAPLSRKQRKALERQQRPAKKEEQRLAERRKVTIEEDSWKHILLHAQDDPSKSIHGIYTRGVDIEPLIVEAVGEWVKGSDRVLAQERSRYGKSRAFVVDMKRQIGSMGGRTKRGEAACYLRVEVEPGKGKTVVKNAFPADTKDLKH